jgi:hypothetical protein
MMKRGDVDMRCVLFPLDVEVVCGGAGAGIARGCLGAGFTLGFWK